jgi:serine protease Do
VGERVVTNAHVITGSRVSVESWEGKTLPASLIRIDRRRDLALLAVMNLDAPAAALGDSDRLQVGTPVVAVGNPLGFTGAVSSGIVHAGGGSDWIYADVRLAPGNSGGPLADLRGEVVGINTMIVSGGLALAIPSRAVQSFLNRAATPRSLGVVVRPVRLRNGGAGMLILELVPDGAAERASLLPGDILLGAGDSRFLNVDDLQAAIERAPAGLLHLDFYRAGQHTLRRVSVRLCAEPALSAA